ncbi:acetate--CoA ligase [bacterium]|nr:acetate--CoA ligase [bacterium]
MALPTLFQGGVMDTVLKESRVFAPPRDFASKASINNLAELQKLRAAALQDPVAFWERTSREVLDWHKPWTRALDWNPPFAKWFAGGEINASVNCLDRHLAKNGSKVALIWEAEDGAVRRFTYQELHREVCRLANVLEKDLGLKSGDTAAIYMPLIPEAVFAMLACARIGVAHSVIFAGFVANSIRDRVNDAESKAILTADFGYRKGQTVKLRETVEAALADCPTVTNVLVLQRGEAKPLSGKWKDWATLVSKASPEHTPKYFDALHPLFFLYTSGTTGKPKGIVHSTGGFLTGAVATAKWIFDFKPEDIYWCTADIGWVTGHTYMVYGPLAHAATVLMYEGAVNHPHPGRLWEIIQKHRATILYTAPTAIRAFMRDGDDYPNKYDLSSLRLLGSVGEPINPEAWMWYHTVIGKERCPIVDTWWQTETGSSMIAGIVGAVPQKPGSASLPLPGIDVAIVDEQGAPCPDGTGGYLVIRKPWPSMLLGIHKDPERFKETYFSKYPGIYFTGDGAHRDSDGYFWIKGRVDDVLNVSGHRLGTMEIESALVSHPKVAEAAVVGRPDDLKGQAVVAFVIPRGDTQGIDVEGLAKEIKTHVAKEIGALARPDTIYLTRTLPKTRSGKIMRRLLRDFAAGKQITGDTTTLENPGLLDLIK